MTTKNFVVKNGLTTGNINLYAGNSNVSANYVVANLSVPATANLGSIGNVIITGGTNGQVLSTDGSGVLSWSTVTSGGTAAYASIIVDTFTGDGTTVNFTLSASPSSKNNTSVNYNGAYQLRGAYTISGTTITFSEAPANGSSIEVTTITGLVTTNGSFTVRNYTGNGSTTAYTITTGTTDSSALVTLNGVIQSPTIDYSVSGTTLTFVTAPTNGMKIQIRELATAAASQAALSSLSVTGTTTLGNVSIGGNLIPTSNNTFSLGNATSYFKDAYIGPGSLYVNGQKVLESVSNTIVVGADVNQAVKIQTSGTGGIIFNPTGTGVIQSQGTFQMQAGFSFTSSDGGSIKFTNPIAVDSLSTSSTNTDLTITANGTGKVKLDDDVQITGNLTVSGTTTTINTQTLSVADNIVDLNSDVTTGTPSENAGIRVIRGDQTATQVRWLESGTSGKWQFTNDGATFLDIVGKDSAGNISAGNLNVSGNVTAAYLVGNGSQLTGLPASYANSNVATFMASFGSNSIVTTGNVTAGYLIGNGSQLTGLPASYANSNVATFMASFGSNNITTTGTITAGNVTATSTVTAATLTETSSIALKENFRPIEDPLTKVMQLLGFIYDRKDGSSKDEVGLVAEDVYKTIPELVGLDANGNPNNVHYTRLTVYLLESIKVLKDEMDRLKGN